MLMSGFAMAATSASRHQRQELRDVVVVHRVHRGEVRAGDAALQPQALRLEGQGLDVARERIVGLVAMHVDAQAALGSDLAQRADRCGAVRHRALEMRDAADDVDAPVERAFEVFAAPRRAVVAVLRKGDELEVEVGRDAALHLEERVDGEKPVVADVDMAADGEEPLRDGEIAVAQRPLDHGLGRQERLQLAPERDALEERAGFVEARAGRGRASRPCGNGRRRRAGATR